MNITVIRQILSDGSHVYNVHVGDLVLHAYTERDVWDLADKIGRAIDEHTCDFAVILEAVS